MKTKNSRGVALLMSLSILALLSVVGISFATAMRLGQHSAQDFFRNIQVRYFAEGGVQRAIAELKYHYTNGAKKTSPVDTEVGNFIDTRFVSQNEGEYWYYGEKYGNNDQNGNGVPYEYFAGTPLENAPAGVSIANEQPDSSLGNLSAHYELKIIDTGSQININDDTGVVGNERIHQLLINLCSYLGAPLDSADADAVFDNRPYRTKEEIKDYLPGNNDAKTNKYNKLKDFITVNSYEDPNNSPDNNTSHAKAPININTASWQVVASVLWEILNDKNLAETTAKNMCIYNTPISYLSWAGIQWVLENYTVLDPSQRNNVFNSVNPNRILNQGTDTKFGLNSGGHYDIECLATLHDAQNNIIARKKISTTVQIYDMWNMTTKAQFRDNADVETNGDKKIQWVNWWDNCPIDLSVSYEPTYNYNASNTIPGSLKLGYWDDFDESDGANDDNFRTSIWKKFDESVDGAPYPVDFIVANTNFDISGGRLHAFGGWPLVTIGYDIDKGVSNNPLEKWYCNSFLLKAYMSDDGDSQHYVPYDFIVNGSLLQRKYDAVSQVLVRAGKFNDNTVVYLSISDGPSEPGHPMPPGPPYPLPNISHENYYPEYNADTDQTFNPAEPPRTPPPPSLATVRIVRGITDEKNETPSPFINYEKNKIFKIQGHLNGNSSINEITTNVYNQAGASIGSESLNTATNVSDDGRIRGDGSIGFYGATVSFYLDNVRVIPGVGFSINDTPSCGKYESKLLKDDTISPSISFPATYEWGTMWAGVSLSPGSDLNNEIVKINHKASGDVDWTSYWPSSSSAFAGGCVWRAIDESDSSDIQFLIVLRSDHYENDYEYNKTPILEDVWVTYLPRTRILYWKEN